MEATKFTEVGYVGRDVEQIIRDLVEVALNMVRERRRREVRARAEAAAEERVLDALVGQGASAGDARKLPQETARRRTGREPRSRSRSADTRRRLGNLDIPGQPDVGVVNLGELFGKAFGGRTKRVRMTVNEAYEPLVREESDKLVDQDALAKEALRVTAEDGIVFLDEIDKIASRSERAAAAMSAAKACSAICCR